MNAIKTYFINLNLFEPDPDSGEREDELKRRSNIIATRIYLIVLILTLTAIAIGLRSTSETTIITLEYPTKDQLASLTFDNQCPCSRSSLSYDKFILMQPIFHQVCSSDFVSDRWINIFSDELNMGSAWYLETLADFRKFGRSYFQALLSYCHLSQSGIEESIRSFYGTTLSSSYALSEPVFRTQIEEIIKQFQVTTVQGFTDQLDLVFNIMFRNQFLSLLQTDILYMYVDNSESGYQLEESYLSPYTDSLGQGCSCLTNTDCRAQSYVQLPSEYEYDYYYGEDKFLIPGVFASCKPMTAIQLSQLECFYNQSCVDYLISYFNTTEKFTALNITWQSKFTENSTVDSIVHEAMIEEWISNISYDKYYTECVPISCTYTQVKQYSYNLIITKLIGLLSGLTLIFGFIIPHCTYLIMQRGQNLEPPERISSKLDVV
ncbi:unnamed protein product [Adineta steineri]|uniref:Uncharacterized protein n=1 Tax=Adineta steineri TaxID=433720 RepID=A0A818JFB5_9BILA|nr:unnamed protein product [Adineta steineri]CAF3539458.1 unnamed protein product [Adineta steineri]